MMSGMLVGGGREEVKVRGGEVERGGGRREGRMLGGRRGRS
jgi:hypothetical protein